MAVLSQLLAQFTPRLGRPPKPRDETGPKDADGDGGRAMESDVDDRSLELSHVVSVACTHSESAHPPLPSTITKMDENGSREQTRQVVRQEDEPAGGCVLRFGDDVVKAWHREDEPEHCQDGRRLVEQRVRGRRGHGAGPVESERARVRETWGLSCIMRSQCPEDAMHAKEIGLRVMSSNRIATFGSKR